ncbi:MAG: 3-hydroxyacyl-CoA dehydrogenase NAD-binding domain-containing protein [Desulfosarcinaceae bacterium]|jgi:enoyl-CoA hydratase/3-hydroxyacyl-CoA dehydrogenase
MSSINKIGVIGAGNMGSGIAQKIIQEGIPVVLVDVKEAFVQRGVATIKNMLAQGVERKIFTAQQVEEILGRLTATTDMSRVSDADLVIEAVFEDKGVKTEVFKKLDAICEPKTILATNTSSYYVKDFVGAISRPDRFVGYHYFYHPAKNRLLEIIPHEGTSSETMEKAVLAAKLHGKTAIVVKDAPGFAVNRFFVPFLNEAVRLLEEGAADIATIEAAAKRGFKIGMGPFELMNVTGVPIAYHSAVTLGNELGPFYAPAPLLKAQVDKKENWPLEGDVDEARVQAVIDRLYGVCLGVAAALVDEGVASIEDTDRGAKIGLRWIQGPFEIMNKIGVATTCDLVDAIAAKYPDFETPRLLTRQKDKGVPFSFQIVDLEVKAGVAYITINRPEAMNALNEATVAQLEARFDEALADFQAKAIVLQGAGKAFVAGADIRYFIKNIKADRIDDIVAFTRRGHELLLKIENASKPTIALLDGLSLGGGSELALACQAIVATPAASLGFPETGIGIYPGLGGMLRLALQVGPDLAKYYVFTGDTIGATKANELGLVARLVKPAEADQAIRDLVSQGLPDKNRSRDLPAAEQTLAQLCAGDNAQLLLTGQTPQAAEADLAAKTSKKIGYKAPLALKMANEIIDQQVGQPIAAAVEIELARLREIFATADTLEGLTSLGRKRPEYKGH